MKLTLVVKVKCEKRCEVDARRKEREIRVKKQLMGRDGRKSLGMMKHERDENGI
jgi:hypothetical protein